MFDQVLDKLHAWGEDLVLLLPNLGAAVLILIAAWIAAGLVGRAIDRFTKRAVHHEGLSQLIRKVVKAVIVSTGFVVALNVLELDDAAKTFLAGAGILGLALGFAFQDLSANFISGVAMAVRRPMRVGDLIETNDLLGVVEEVDMRSSRMRTLDGKVITIPNRKIYETSLINHSRLGQRRVDLDVGVSYGDDLDKVARVTIEAVRGVQPRLDRDVELYFTGFGDSSITFQVQFWIAFANQPDYLLARSQAVMAIRKAYKDNGITIPFPIRTLDFGIVGGERLDQSLGRWKSAS